MIVDCDGCVVRGSACDDCVVNALFQIGSGHGDLDAAEVEAVELFARAGFDVTVLRPPAPIPRRGSTPGRSRRGRHAA
jgi:hypothetical protein